MASRLLGSQRLGILSPETFPPRRASMGADFREGTIGLGGRAAFPRVIGDGGVILRGMSVIPL